MCACVQVTVILHHMFKPAELAAEPNAATELENEVMEEAKKIGPVEKVGRLLDIANQNCAFGNLFMARNQFENVARHSLA